MTTAATIRAPVPAPRQGDDFPFPVSDRINRCSHCGTPMFLGDLAPGSVIEVECRRHKCRGHREPVRFVKL